ncbi:28561_t:CDS:2, partial [Racocetra persica]
GQGVPLAWLLTESQDSETIKLWLHALKEDVWIDPVNVILDNDDAKISTICDIFTMSNIFLCWWHVKRVWRRWINKQIPGKERNNLFQDLNQLLSISDKSEVNNALIKFEQKWQHTAAHELGVRRMNSHYKVWRQFELNSVAIDNGSIFHLNESTYFVKSTQSENDYMIEQMGDNALTLTCNCEAYIGNPVPCKHIFVVTRKYSIKIPEQTTYLPLLNDDEQFTIDNSIIRIQENNFKKKIEEMNHHINQQLERLDNLCQKMDLNSIPLEKKEDIANKLEE